MIKHLPGRHNQQNHAGQNIQDEILVYFSKITLSSNLGDVKLENYGKNIVIGFSNDPFNLTINRAKGHILTGATEREDETAYTEQLTIAEDLARHLALISVNTGINSTTQLRILGQRNYLYEDDGDALLLSYEASTITDKRVQAEVEFIKDFTHSLAARMNSRAITHEMLVAGKKEIGKVPISATGKFSIQDMPIFARWLFARFFEYQKSEDEDDMISAVLLV